MRRFFDPQPLQQDQSCVLGELASHHIGKVLRMRVGDSLVLFNGTGGEWVSEITVIDKRRVTIMPRRFSADNRSAPLQVQLMLPMLKGERMDYALQKATELGVSTIQLLLCERGEVRLSAERLEKRMQHWQQVLISACEQCGLNLLPALHPPRPLIELLAQPSVPQPAAAPETTTLRLIAHPGAAPLTGALLSNRQAICLLTGPEGGFSEAEIDAAEQAGYQAFALGERVLRAETAPLALLAALWTAHSLNQSIST